MTWTPTDWAAVDAKNLLLLLEVAATGRRIYLVEDGGDRFYRFDNLDSDWVDDIPDGSMWVDEIMWLVRDGLLRQVDGGREVVITDAGREHLGQASRPGDRHDVLR